MQSEQVGQKNSSRWSGFAAPVIISFSSAVRTIGAQAYLSVDFMWSCNVLDGMPYCLLFGCCMHRPWALHCWQLPWLYASVHHSTGSFLLSSCTLLALLLYFVVYKRVFWILRMRSLTLFCVYIVLCFCCCICLPYMGELQNEWMNEWIWPFNVASTVRNLMPVLLSVHGVR